VGNLNLLRTPERPHFYLCSPATQKMHQSLNLSMEDRDRIRERGTEKRERREIETGRKN
jgi:hypothetical protein